MRLGLLLGGPLVWLLVAYIGSLIALLVTSLYHYQDDPTGLVQHLSTSPSATNYRRLLDQHVYRDVAFRTIGAALTVTVIDLLVALPVAFYIAKLAAPWLRRVLVVAVTMPLWAGYLVKGYAWRAILDPAGGVLHQVFGHSPGFGLSGTTLTLAYLWLPYMIIPIYAGLERLPNSLLEASTDLGAKAATTFARIVLPQLLPSIVAGSIFTFALTLGDFYMNQIVGGTTQFLGNVVYREFSANLPFAAAYATLPIVIMVAYLLGARSTGALEEL
ncbi:MAG: binding-protein-dependent transport system inner rane component [Actinomycetia bacterium]|nr:binding-protein-dependent transport system inner rane component [Actinomycetes bacterium]